MYKILLIIAMHTILSTEQPKECGIFVLPGEKQLIAAVIQHAKPFDIVYPPDHFALYDYWEQLALYSTYHNESSSSTHSAQSNPTSPETVSLNLSSPLNPPYNDSNPQHLPQRQTDVFRQGPIQYRVFAAFYTVLEQQYTFPSSEFPEIISATISSTGSSSIIYPKVRKRGNYQKRTKKNDHLGIKVGLSSKHPDYRKEYNRLYKERK